MTGKVLAFDTATEQVALALATFRGADLTDVVTADQEAPRAALGRLVPSIDRLLSAHELRVGDLAAIVIGRGPGSFTGVRIAVATAKGLSHAAKVPLFGVSTLDAVAWNMRCHDGLVGVMGDAMRGEVYPALYRISGGCVERLTPERVVPPTLIASEWAALDERVLITGNGLRKYSDVFAGVCEIAVEADWTVTGEGLLLAYGDAVRRGNTGDGDPGTLLPIYTRLSDAEENERARNCGDAAHPAQSTMPNSGVAGPDGSE